MGTINYEVICMIKESISRVFIKDGEVINVRD